MISNWALIAVTAGSSGRRCSDSTPSSAPPSVARFLEIDSRRSRTTISADGEHHHDDDGEQHAQDDQEMGLVHAASPKPSVSAFM